MLTTITKNGGCQREFDEIAIDDELHSLSLSFFIKGIS